MRSFSFGCCFVAATIVNRESERLVVACAVCSILLLLSTLLLRVVAADSTPLNANASAVVIVSRLSPPVVLLRCRCAAAATAAARVCCCCCWSLLLCCCCCRSWCSMLDVLMAAGGGGRECLSLMMLIACEGGFCVFRSFFLKISVDHDHKICDRQITKCDHKSQNHRSQNFVISKRRRSGNRCILASILDFRRKPSFFWFVAVSAHLKRLTLGSITLFGYPINY